MIIPTQVAVTNLAQRSVHALTAGAFAFGLLAPAAVAAPVRPAPEHASAAVAALVRPPLEHSTPATPAPTAPPSESARAGLEALRLELNRLLRTGAARNGEWGLLALSLERGDTLFALNPDVPRAPASNQKVFTTAAALHHLGPDFRFQTYLLAKGEVREGVLEGDLVLYGTGDPTFSDRLLPGATAPFRGFAQALRSRGIHTVRGEVLGDGSYFRGPQRRPSWNPRDLNEWFAAPVSALSFNENMVTLRITPSSPGRPPRVVTDPFGAMLPVLNGGMTVDRRPRATLSLIRDDPDAPIQLRGEMALGQADVWRRLTVSDPPAFAASVLKAVLEQEGIRVEGGSGRLGDADSPVTGRRLVAPGFDDSPKAWTVAVHRSPPLRDILEVVNKKSHNLFSEALLFTLGRVREGDGSFDGGSRAVRDYLIEVAGVPAEGLHVEDGSGLSRLNRAAPSGFVRVLAHVESGEHAELFRASLPEAGNRNELARMYRSTAAGNLRAKTGTINRVSALSGIVRSRDGEPILFSIIANDVPSSWAAKQVEDRIGIQLASFSRPPEGVATDED